MKRIDALKVLHSFTANIPVISTCGATSREWASLGRRDNHLYVVDTMGLAPSIALGVSLAIEETSISKCIAIEGDGGLLMNPNVLVSAYFLNARKWLLLVLDNGCFGSTGGQRSLASSIDLTSVIEGFGLTVLKVDTVDRLKAAIEHALNVSDKPMVIHAKIWPGNENTPFLNDDPTVFSNHFKVSLRSG
jgi:sulfopyruvate decarboxylase subunit beta